MTPLQETDAPNSINPEADARAERRQGARPGMQDRSYHGRSTEFSRSPRHQLPLARLHRCPQA
ncbi:hypothetical protein BQ8482_170021 [Mesorhizobium delmotii]|uniref:Uncharacterized protein n=1 Tax=Mesorhizobium delmotii TaxID=1631247 RepID=A0A2P9AHQ1_9HYPH|nr:hypothetical protein BQ8482_170021 [Mesorhizobium delmotii]